jgi:hypothetical protein
MAPEAAMAKWETPVFILVGKSGSGWLNLALIAGLGIISGSQTIGAELLLPRRIRAHTRGCKKRQETRFGKKTM